MNNILSGLSGRELQILSCIQKNGPITKSGLMAGLKLKLSTLNRSMSLLESRKLVAESGRSHSSGGRRPAEYDAAQEGIYMVGVDISRTYVQVVLLNLKIRVLEACRFEMSPGRTPRECAGRIAGALEQMISRRSIEKSAILGIGVGTVGPMDRKSGMLLHPRGFPGQGWDGDIPLKDLLQEQTGLPCSIDNGANTAVLAECLFGTGRGRQCVVYIHCGVGIRSAVIRDGVMIRAMNDREDAFAHMTVDFNGTPCRCGGRGCLENYVSLDAIHRRCQSRLKDPSSYNGLMRLANGGDEAAAEAFRRSAEILGVGISNLAKLLNPGLVILSGPLVSGYGPYFSICTGAFRRQSPENCELEFSKEGAFGNRAVSVGAGLMILEQYFNEMGRNE